jgi:hypothetical protein
MAPRKVSVPTWRPGSGEERVVEMDRLIGTSAIGEEGIFPEHGHGSRALAEAAVAGVV